MGVPTHRPLFCASPTTNEQGNPIMTTTKPPPRCTNCSDEGHTARTCTNEHKKRTCETCGELTSKPHGNQCPSCYNRQRYRESARPRSRNPSGRICSHCSFSGHNVRTCLRIIVKDSPPTTNNSIAIALGRWIKHQEKCFPNTKIDFHVVEVAMARLKGIK